MGADDPRSEKSQIRANVIGGLIVAAVIAVVGIFAGLVKPVLVATGKALIWLLKALTTEIPVPAWIPVLSILIMLWILSPRARALQKHLHKVQANLDKTIMTPSVTPRPILSQIEVAVFRALIDADGKFLSVDDLNGLLGEKRLLIEKALEVLSEKSWVDDRLSRSRGRSFRVSSRGIEVAQQFALL